MQLVTRVGVTLGDPAGIGPEIVAATLAAAPVECRRQLVVYGDREPLERGAHAMRVELPADVAIIGDGAGERGFLRVGERGQEQERANSKCPFQRAENHKPSSSLDYDDEK